MASRRRFIGGVVALGTAIAAMSARGKAQTAERAEVIFRNGTIIPIAAPQGPVEAIATSGGKILAVGSESQVSALRGKATMIVDLQGRTMLPGLIDPHHHTVLSALVASLLINLGYPQYRTRDDVIAGLRATAGKTASGQWIRAGYFDNLLQGGDLSMEMLDAVSTEHPIFVWYVNGHTAAANSTAFQLAKIPENVGVLPGGGHFGRTPSGQLNGLIYEEPALARFIALAIPDITPDTVVKTVASYTKRVAATGNTTLHEPGTIKPEWVPLLAKLSTTLDVRLSASFSSDNIAESKAFAALGPGSKARVISNSRLSLYGIKFWADGSNQQETAAQTIPYLHTASKGQTNYPESEMANMCHAAMSAGWPILIHCQGDAAIDDALDAIESAYGANPPTGLNRIEHATMVRQDQLERMKRLGVEPTFLMPLLLLYGSAYRDEILGPQRTEFMMPAGACVKLGIPFSLHTDSPAGPIGPLPLIQTAVTRRCVIDASVIGPDQAITIGQALMAATINAARQIGMDDRIGSLEAGKEADLTILESDPFKTDPGEIAAIKISETWVGGEKKFG
ncbi:MAG TPA: amidohydrolase [Candidatus Cybelea sp.]|nr:amidohydrolase [Candidatus Cybelea sp.]